MASSSATTIIQPDITTSIPVSGALYVQNESFDVSVANPAGAQLVWGAPDFAGGGPVQLRQAGADIARGTTTRVPITALQLFTQNQGGPLNVVAGTVIPAPDFSIAGGAGASYVRVNVFSATPIDWVGGIDTPIVAPGVSPLGVTLFMTNVSGSGVTMNIVGVASGGTIWMPAPYCALGFLETAQFIWEGSGWICLGKTSQWFGNGGNGPQAGSRVIVVSDNTPTMLYKFPAVAAVTPGSALEFNVAAQVQGSGGTTSATWLGGRAVWDGANNPLGVFFAGTPYGTNAGLPPAGWALQQFSAVTGFNGINFIGEVGPTITTARISVNPIAPPF